MSAAAPRIVYITSKGHSGSTLTEMLLDAHPAITSLGEVKLLNTPRGVPCRCELDIPAACPFWRKVDETLQASTGRRLAELEATDLGSKRFASDNSALFAAASAVSGSPILVDSSKDYHRLSALLDSRAFDLQVIHLVRNPYGVVHSNVRRGRDLIEHSRDYSHNLIRTRQLLARHRPRVLDLRYEALTDDPEGVLRRVMEWLELEFDPAQLRWAEQDSHTIAGNPMRATRESRIHRDDGWQSGLTRLQKLGIAWWTLPARVPGTWLFHTQRRLRRLEDRLLRGAAASARPGPG